MIEFSEWLQAAREKNNLTQLEAAKKIGVPFRTYQNWEYGRRTPNQFTIKHVKNVIEL